MSKWRTLRKTPTLEKAFEELRQSDAHIGMGDVRLTIEARMPCVKWHGISSSI